MPCHRLSIAPGGYGGIGKSRLPSVTPLLVGPEPPEVPALSPGEAFVDDAAGRGVAAFVEGGVGFGTGNGAASAGF